MSVGMGSSRGRGRLPGMAGMPDAPSHGGLLSLSSAAGPAAVLHGRETSIAGRVRCPSLAHCTGSVAAASPAHAAAAGSWAAAARSAALQRTHSSNDRWIRLASKLYSSTCTARCRCRSLQALCMHKGSSRCRTLGTAGVLEMPSQGHNQHGCWPCSRANSRAL